MAKSYQTVLFDFGGTLDSDGVAWKERMHRHYRDEGLAMGEEEFARLFYAGAIEMLLEGDTEEALSRLRDLVHAEITFKELAKETGLGEKTLHRMLNRNGNPTWYSQYLLFWVFRQKFRDHQSEDGEHQDRLDIEAD